MDYLLEQANISLKHTPELLPVLKEVGVVDSGGAGLVKVLEGMIMGLKGKVVERKQISNPEDQQETIAGAGLDNEEFGYCTEFILRLVDSEEKKKFNEKRFTNVLASLGNSLVVVRDEDIVKVHVHTLKPGMALNFAQGYGEFVKLKIENMQEQHSELAAAGQAPDQAKPKEKKEYAIIATSVGDGLKELFENLQVDYIVSGGQTMNPSTEDFVEAIKTVNAKNIFILPNNKNIVMASEQACIVAEDLGSNCKVIPSKSIPQGLVACMNFNSDATFEENESEMRDAITRVKTGQVTFAIKDTKIDEVSIRKDEFMGISEGKIICCEKDPVESAKKLLDRMIDDDSAIVTLLYGEATSKEEAEEVAAYIEDKYTIEVELHNGGQPVYNYIFGVE
jgi:DAK2 domain fusion protein YloV